MNIARRRYLRVHGTAVMWQTGYKARAKQSARDLIATLNSKSSDATKMHRRVTGVFLGVGISLGLTVVAGYLVIRQVRNGVDEDHPLRQRVNPLVALPLFWPAIASGQLGVKATDAVAVRWLSRVIAFVASLLGLAFLYIGSTTSCGCGDEGQEDGGHGMASSSEDGGACDMDPLDVQICTTRAVQWYAQGAVALATALYVGRVLLFRRQAGPRRGLRDIWRVTRALFAGIAVVYLLRAIVILILAGGELSEEFSSGDLMSILAIAVVWILTSLATDVRCRRRVHALLARRFGGEEGQWRAAAVIACLATRKGSSEEAMQMMMTAAEARFRTMPFVNLRADDFTRKAGDPLADDELRARTEKATLGEIDAFLSHSWHDDAAKKWTTLSKWADENTRVDGKPPKLWFDRACIDQKNIDDDLATLPVFLSGCKNLLVLAGETYPCRLWCVMEIYTFYQMHHDDVSRKSGQREMASLVQVLPVLRSERGELRASSEESVLEAVRSQFLRFDVAACRCFQPPNQPDLKEHLLGVIETGWGDHTSFNQMVRQTFPNLISLDHLTPRQGRGSITSSLWGVRESGHKATNGPNKEKADDNLRQHV